jgi:hypothetical protein
MAIDKAIKIFAQFLNNSWITASQLLIDRSYTTNEDSINDWLQANWELLVERKVLMINEHLEVYGEGADFNGSSSRITDISALPNFKLKIKSKNGNDVLDVLNNEKVRLNNVTFDKIVGFKNGFYKLVPDFSYVLITDDNLGIERVVALDDIEFELVHLKRIL